MSIDPRESERVVLGAAMNDPASARAAVETLTPADFSAESRGLVFGAISRLVKGGHDPDPVAVVNRLREAEQLALVGGAAAVSELSDVVPFSMDLAVHIEAVRRAARERHAERMARTFIEGARTPGVVAGLKRALDDLDAPFSGAVGVRMSDVEREVVRWLWPGRMPLGMMTVIDGHPGQGKSTLSLDLAARVSAGQSMPFSDGPPISGGVVLLSAEDSLGATVRPRLEAAGADLQRIVALSTMGEGAERRVLSIPEDLEAVEQAMAQVDAKLVVVDPLSSFVSGRIDMHRDGDVRRALSALADLASRTGAAVILVRHLRKSATGDPLLRGLGSVGIIAAARAGLLVAPDPADEDVRVIASTKGNLAPAAPSIRWRLQSVGDVARVEWIEECSTSAHELLAEDGSGRRAEAREDAVEFLQSTLANGPVRSTIVTDRAAQAGIAERTLWRAKNALDVTSYRESGAWWWQLPAESKSANNEKVAGMAGLGWQASTSQLVPSFSGKAAKSANPCGSGGLESGSLDRSDILGRFSRLEPDSPAEHRFLDHLEASGWRRGELMELLAEAAERGEQ